MFLPMYDVVALTVLGVGAALCLIWLGDRLNRAALSWGVAHVALALAALIGYRFDAATPLGYGFVSLLLAVVAQVALWGGTQCMRGREPRFSTLLLQATVLLLVQAFLALSCGMPFGRLVTCLVFCAVYAASAYLFSMRLRLPWVGAAFAFEAMAFMAKLSDWPNFSTPQQNPALFWPQWLAHLGLAMALIHLAIARSQRRLHNILRHLPDAVAARRIDGTVLYCNMAFARLVGAASPSDLVGTQMPVLAGKQEHLTTLCEEINALASAGVMDAPQTLEREVHPLGADPFPAEISFVNFLDLGQLSVIVQIRDISERKRAEERIHDLAFFDQLTGLPNRRLLSDRLRHALTSSARSGSYGALFALDLDHFKVFNDSFGHAAGDRLLVEVARRLQRTVREDDTVGRTGGDDFALVLCGLGLSEAEAANAASMVAEKCLRALDEPSEMLHFDRIGSASIGVVLFRGSATAAEELIKQAEMTMYSAKNAGRNTVRFFDPQLEAGIKRRAELEVDLRRGIESGQLFNV